MKSENKKANSVHVKDSQKTVDIRDAFNKLRYLIILTSYPLNELTTQYEINVVNVFSGPDPVTIFIDKTTDYANAMKIFDNTVINYTCLVKAETKDYSDIEIFEQKIGYKKTCPACCGTCKYGSRSLDYERDDFVKNTRMRCTNEDNIKEYGFDVDVPDYKIRPSHFIGDIPEHKNDKFSKILPKVSIFGICKRYEKMDQSNGGSK